MNLRIKMTCGGDPPGRTGLKVRQASVGIQILMTPSVDFHPLLNASERWVFQMLRGLSIQIETSTCCDPMVRQRRQSRRRNLASVERESETYPRKTWGKQRMTQEKRKSLFITKGSNFSATYQLLHPGGSYFQRLPEPIWWKAGINRVTCTLFTSLHSNKYAWDRRCHRESHSPFSSVFYTTV